jgi:hypothetical protein
MSLPLYIPVYSVGRGVKEPVFHDRNLLEYNNSVPFSNPNTPVLSQATPQVFLHASDPRREAGRLFTLMKLSISKEL